MIVVSDSSILINLAWIGKLDLLPHIYKELVVPTAVWHEIVDLGTGKPGAKAIKNASWIRVKEPQNKFLIQTLRQELDAGEAEAIALAIEENANLLLMDERIGRQTAQQFNLAVIGVIGILILAKQSGLLSEIKYCLDALRQEAGFFISEPLYQRVLYDADESF